MNGKVPATEEKGCHYVKKPELINYVRCFSPPQPGSNQSLEDYFQIFSEEMAVKKAFEHPGCFAFQLTKRKEVTIDNELFTMEMHYGNWRGYFGKAYNTLELAGMGEEAVQILGVLRHNKLTHAVLTRIGNWHPLRPEDRIFDPETTAPILRKKS